MTSRNDDRIKTTRSTRVLRVKERMAVGVQASNKRQLPTCAMAWWLASRDSTENATIPRAYEEMLVRSAMVGVILITLLSEGNPST